jgi:hypothetical protein
LEDGHDRAERRERDWYRQPTFHHVFQLGSARLDEMMADGVFLQTIGFGELPN